MKAYLAPCLKCQEEKTERPEVPISRINRDL
jgi:hypothetical protein